MNGYCRFTNFSWYLTAGIFHFVPSQNPQLKKKSSHGTSGEVFSLQRPESTKCKCTVHVFVVIFGIEAPKLCLHAH